MQTYAEVYQRSIEQPESFWAEAAEGLHWEQRWEQVLDQSAEPIPRWFAGAQLNTCYNA
ncbi:acetyl-coenzyme A synthetase N-terminal domain-containing protein, partial [Halochromatium sp.]